MIWTDEQCDTLRAMWPEGYPARHIANTIGGVTKNAVIGKAHRLGLSHPRPLVTKVVREGRGDCGGGVVQRIRSKADALHPLTIKIKAIKPPALPAVPDEQIPQAQRKTLFELENHHCRWPIGEIGTQEFFFCGNPTADLALKEPYCAHHKLKAWVKYRGPRRPASYRLIAR